MCFRVSLAIVVSLALRDKVEQMYEVLNHNNYFHLLINKQRRISRHYYE